MGHMSLSPSEADPSRRNFLKSSAGAAAAAVAAGISPQVMAAEESKRSGGKTNLLFILCDQWRASAVSWEDEQLRTPNLEALAKDGVVFNRAYAANPVCTPNRSCILTGRHSHQHGMITNSLMLPPAEKCWPEVFKDAGYATHYIGKWHMDGEPKPGFVPPGWRRRGFETFEGFNRGHIYHRHWGFDNEGEPLPFERGGDPYYEPTLQAELTMDFIREQQPKNPWACFVSWGPPHTPFNPPDSFDKYSAEDIEPPANVPEAHKAKAKKELAGYYGLCESLDHELGRILKCLEEQGAAEDTLIVFTSDHGELAGCHGKYRKGEPENESLQIPLVISHKAKIKGGRTSEVLFNSIDHFPTLLSLCGLKDPGTATGSDLSAFVTGAKPDTEGPTSIYCEGKVTGSPAEGEKPGRAAKGKGGKAVPTAWRTIVTPERKLTVRGSWDNVEHLFDVKADPLEQKNLVDEAKYSDEIAALTKQLKKMAKETGDTFPLRPLSAQKEYTEEEAATAFN